MAFGLGLGLMLSVVTMSSFTPEKRALEIVYLLSADGLTYNRFSTDGSFPSTGGCESVDDYEPCHQRYNTAQDPGVSSFSSSSIPANNIPGNPESYWAFP
ncbi:hypothetical protein SAMN04488101_11231 [Pedobacter nyackensis]|uniref:Uncharacterized protein n=2 Tax=Pedobacter nyackensis TaxID=475255 RepID=A0A1W2EFH6_9SPHI|nr:hypothetical protein SAMN04488101_11231 [Pedobacter nyackensis]